MSRNRRLVLLGLKLAVAGALIAWLVYGGRLDFGALRLFVDEPALLAANLGVVAVVVLLGAMRWRLLLRLVEVRLGIGRALQLHFTAMFFNVVIPGSIGGDVVRAMYVARDEPKERRTGVYLIGFVDRLIGVASLVLVAAIVVAARGGTISETPQLRELGIAVMVLAAITIVSPIVVLAAIRRSKVVRPGIIGQLVDATRLVVSRPALLAGAVALGLALHGAGLLLFVSMTGSAASVATVYPLGMLTLLLPISYAGIGVGHVAFERLFAIVGLSGGATAFNVYLIGQTAPCLLGVFPYLTLRRAGRPPTEAEAREAQG